jgi:glycosyltransferase involved in cell wall biosynthesis
MARISVLMGIYNCAGTLVEALDSLYAQTYQDFNGLWCEQYGLIVSNKYNNVSVMETQLFEISSIK